MDSKKTDIISKRLSIAMFMGVVFLVPWTVYLAFTLPANFSAHYWAIAWVGFDIALILVLGFTAWAAYFQRQILVAASIVASTLLICDAWFDVIMSLGTNDAVFTIITAVLVEIPLAIFFIMLARKIMKRTLSIINKLTGNDSASHIHDATLLPIDSHKKINV